MFRKVAALEQREKVESYISIIIQLVLVAFENTFDSFFLFVVSYFMKITLNCVLCIWLRAKHEKYNTSTISRRGYKISWQRFNVSFYAVEPVQGNLCRHRHRSTLAAFRVYAKITGIFSIS